MLDWGALFSAWGIMIPPAVGGNPRPEADSAQWPLSQKRRRFTSHPVSLASVACEMPGIPRCPPERSAREPTCKRVASPIPPLPAACDAGTPAATARARPVQSIRGTCFETARRCRQKRNHNVGFSLLPHLHRSGITRTKALP